MEIGQMTTFDDFSTELKSSDDDDFTFDNPPTLGWWRREYSLGLPSAAFVHYFMLSVGNITIELGAEHWEGQNNLSWEDYSGISGEHWSSITDELGETGNGLLSFQFYVIKGEDFLLVRPTDKLLHIFGLSLAVYDAVARLDEALKDELAVETVARQLLSQQGVNAVRLWVSRGGAERIRNVEELESLVGTILDVLPPSDEDADTE
jgi:hypothetical protein